MFAGHLAVGLVLKMDITTFMIAVYCLMEDTLGGMRLRKRGPQPTLRDSEVLTIEVVGEFLGLDTESSIFTHFCQYYSDWFPGLRQITRTTFTRQAAKLWKVKRELWQLLAQQIPHDPNLSIIDSFPVPVCRFARATYSRTFRETEGAEEVLQGVAGYVLADRNYWKPDLDQRLKSYGLYLLAPYKSAKHEKQPYPHFLTHMRYRIETVFGQLVERFHAKRIWARSLASDFSLDAIILESYLGCLLLFSVRYLLFELCQARVCLNLHMALVSWA
jgi:hypothetical protein